MSAVEETQKEVAISAVGRNDAFGWFLSSVLRLLSSVRFGVTLLITLVVLSMIGMLIMQQNVENFDKYFAALTPAQKLIYGKIGFFDIYHAWYFNLLLLVLSLNIVLATIERVPKSWKIARRRKLEAGRSWLLSQQQHAQIRVDANAGEKAAIESV